MQITLQVLQAMQYCAFKAWQLSIAGIPEEGDALSNDARRYKIARAAWQFRQQAAALSQNEKKPSLINTQAQKLLEDTEAVLDKDQAPPFYKINHCSGCQFNAECRRKLKDRDCISLLAGITPKVRAKYYRKGITTITQLAHLFRPRRRKLPLPATGSYLWELKALAIREQKTFVVCPPDLFNPPVAIYLDFEGIPDEGWCYLLGGLLKQEGKPDERFSFWADSKESEEANFRALFALFHQYPDAYIYHFGSYETKALKQAAKKLNVNLNEEWAAFEKRTVNLLRYLRTHIYPPTYSNGLKELGAFLGFTWAVPEADGLLSITWRKQWEATGLPDRKAKLLQYNLDDCAALYKVHQWFCQLAAGGIPENVQQVAEMKRHTPYHLQNNADYGEDFKLISEAAYFDYQRNKIYWRNDGRKQTPAAAQLSLKPARTKQGVAVWQPKKANEIIIVPPLKECPYCTHTRLYQSRKIKTTVKQTDLKFTVSGVRRHVVEYRSGSAKCAKCGKRAGNKNLRMMHYGDNLFALAVNYYVQYHISHELISKLIQEHYGVWVSYMYLVMYKGKWWERNREPVADYTREIVLNSPVIHIDETTIKLSKEAGYVWVFATTHTVFYLYTPTREAAFLQDILKNYKGIIVSDFYPGYDTLHVTHQKCLVHLLRDLNDDLFKNPFDEAYKAIVAAFGKLLRKIIETIDRHGLQKIYLETHEKDTENFYSDFLEPAYKSKLAVKYVKRFKKHWEQLWTFLHYDNVPWNNNNAEAAVKAFAQHRRGVKGQMHVTGLNTYLQMLTVAQTCRYRNISFLSFLRKKKGLWENIPPEALPGFLPFEQARLFIRRLGFERKAQWNAWKSAGNRPPFIPPSPEKTYKGTGWINWHDWLGFSFLPFAKARTFMRKLKLTNRNDYWAWLASGKRPKNIPYSPEKVYKYTGWVDLGDWLGTGNKGRQKKKMLTYLEAKTYVQALGLKTQDNYFKWRKSGNRPETIPSSPNTVYAEFEGWGEFLGTGNIANQCKEYYTYNQAKAFLKLLYIRSIRHYRLLYDAGIIPLSIPKNPWAYYKKQGSWISYPHFWGHE